MPTDRVLVEIITAANMTGVKEAQAGFLGLSAGTLALGAALGGLVLAGKSAVENTEAQEKAQLSLKQATAAGKLGFDDLQKSFDVWAETNKRYIKDQYDAETALASFVRAGNSASDSMRLLNDALDLAVIKTEDVTEAQQQIELAMVGSAKALKFLGISTDEYNAIMKDKLLTTEQKHLALMALIETKTKDGRKATTDLSQSTQALNKDWQDISTKVGPPLLGLFAGIAGGVDAIITKLNDLGNNKDWNTFLSGALGHIQDLINLNIGGLKQLIDLINSLDTGGKAAAKNLAASGQKGTPHGARATGGPVMAGQTYTVGEQGPETLVMGGQSGSIVPNGAGSGGGNHVHLHIDRGAYIDGPSLDYLTNQIARRLKMATGI